MTDQLRDDLALLTQRSYEAEEAWRAHRAAEARWREAAERLRDAIERVRVALEGQG